MLIDIDNFKSVNDVYGHTMGDHVISVIAGVISSQFRSTDYVGRVGGDEFCVLMADIPSREIALIKAENLVSLVKYKENLSIPENISISVGVAFSEADDQCYDELAAKADQALYVSKKSGKGRYSVYGEEQQAPEKVIQALVWSGSRNVTSMMEFSLPNYVQLKTVASVEEIRSCMEEKTDEDIPALIVDVSEEEDQGQRRWQELRKLKEEHTFSMIAICKEGNLAQMKCALETEELSDLLLAPLEANTLKRRVKIWMQNCKL
jgi:diguanylate cyclase (GGDEF)-like protein